MSRHMIVDLLKETLKALKNDDDEAVNECTKKMVSASGTCSRDETPIWVSKEILDLVERGYKDDALEALKLYVDVQVETVANKEMKAKQEAELVGEIGNIMMSDVCEWLKKKETREQTTKEKIYWLYIILKACEFMTIQFEKMAMKIAHNEEPQQPQGGIVIIGGPPR